MIIAGDIGGTKTNVALFDPEGAGGVGRPLLVESFQSRRHASLEAILTEFVEEHRPLEITHACFGVAGPVVGGRVDATNLAWKISEEGLAAALGVPRVRLINDLEATAYGIDELAPEQFH